MSQNTSSPQSLAEGDLLIAAPQEPQQLFVIVPGASQPAAHWQALAQHIARHFPQAAVAIVAAPQVVQGTTNMPAAVDALRALLRRWQAHAGLDFTRTAVVAQGQAATVALEAAMQYADVAARLFALGGHLPEQAAPLSEQTSLHCVYGQHDAGMTPDGAREIGQCLQALEADFTLDVLPDQTVAADTPDLRQCILHRLQNHVPRRLWREALASAAASACVPPVDEDKRQLH